MDILKTIQTDEIPFNLHESYFNDYSLKGDVLTLRVGINCALNDNLGINCDEINKYYLYDIRCYGIRNIIWDEEPPVHQQILEILSLTYENNKYDLWLQCCIYVYNLSFECNEIEWIPIKVFTAKEFENIMESY